MHKEASSTKPSKVLYGLSISFFFACFTTSKMKAPAEAANTMVENLKKRLIFYIPTKVSNETFWDNL